MTNAQAKIVPGLAVQLGDRPLQVVGARPEIADFWRDAQAGRWEDATLRFIDIATARPGSVLVDVGAWIGPISLYAAPRVEKVIALEPDPVAHQELAANIEANVKNVEVWNAAVDQAPGVLKLYAPEGFGGSVTSSIGSGEPIEVKTVTFDDLDAAAGASQAILKVDIEGHEFRVMDALIDFASRRRAPTHLSLHPRSIWSELRKSGGWLAARRETMRATMDAIDKLQVVGPVLLSETGGPATRAAVFRLIYLKRRPKNFSVEVREPRQAA
ncbi:FkbM family methyltransferase [Caulobacter sp. 17J65-9]|uniref:FkbM family methyltransferase n=1 Tax=Caulobacter sp. 17J65-9 TaxID=2709382 RepID=UPI0013C8BA1A|nr:FkbM family methyltransferase [Caulobacter sp. 17J65-9]NEX94380.1 FkbM family methyltransferase [Caulobacter sp. 17J65-9]